jgi:predicted nucleotidyltransferase
MSESYIQSFYAVINVDTSLYFAGFDPEANVPQMVESPLGAKLFSNKHQVKLRPNEKLVELEITLSTDNVVVSEPFRPRRREPKVYAAS